MTLAELKKIISREEDPGKIIILKLSDIFDAEGNWRSAKLPSILKIMANEHALAIIDLDTAEKDNFLAKLRTEDIHLVPELIFTRDSTASFKERILTSFCQQPPEHSEIFGSSSTTAAASAITTTTTQAQADPIELIIGNIKLTVKPIYNPDESVPHQLKFYVDSSQSGLTTKWIKMISGQANMEFVVPISTFNNPAFTSLLDIILVLTRLEIRLNSHTFNCVGNFTGLSPHQLCIGNTHPFRFSHNVTNIQQHFDAYNELARIASLNILQRDEVELLYTALKRIKTKVTFEYQNIINGIIAIITDALEHRRGHLSHNNQASILQMLKLLCRNNRDANVFASSDFHTLYTDYPEVNRRFNEIADQIISELENKPDSYINATENIFKYLENLLLPLRCSPPYISEQVYGLTVNLSRPEFSSLPKKSLFYYVTQWLINLKNDYNECHRNSVSFYHVPFYNAVNVYDSCLNEISYPHRHDHQFNQIIHEWQYPTTKIRNLFHYQILRPTTREALKLLLWLLKNSLVDKNFLSKFARLVDYPRIELLLSFTSSLLFDATDIANIQEKPSPNTIHQNYFLIQFMRDLCQTLFELGHVEAAVLLLTYYSISFHISSKELASAINFIQKNQHDTKCSEKIKIIGNILADLHRESIIPAQAIIKIIEKLPREFHLPICRLLSAEIFFACLEHEISVNSEINNLSLLALRNTARTDPHYGQTCYWQGYLIYHRTNTPIMNVEIDIADTKAEDESTTSETITETFVPFESQEEKRNRLLATLDFFLETYGAGYIPVAKEDFHRIIKFCGHELYFMNRATTNDLTHEIVLCKHILLKEFPGGIFNLETLQQLSDSGRINNLIIGLIFKQAPRLQILEAELAKKTATSAAKTSTSTTIPAAIEISASTKVQTTTSTATPFWSTAPADAAIPTAAPTPSSGNRKPPTIPPPAA